MFEVISLFSPLYYCFYERLHYMSIHETFVFTRFRSSVFSSVSFVKLCIQYIFCGHFPYRSFFCISISWATLPASNYPLHHIQNNTGIHYVVHSLSMLCPHYHFRLGREFSAFVLKIYHTCFLFMFPSTFINTHGFGVRGLS